VLFAQGHAVEHLHCSVNFAEAENFIVDIVDAKSCHIQRDPKPIDERRVGALVFGALISRNQRNPRWCLGFDAIARHRNSTAVESGAQVVHSIAR